MWHFLKLVVRGFFFPGAPVSSPPPSVNGLAHNVLKAKINVINTPSNPIAELSLRTKRHTCCS